MDIGSSLIKLADMLNPKEDSDSDDDQPCSQISQMGPGQIGPKTKNKDKAPTTTPYAKKESKDIWDADEVQEGSEFDDVYDPRPQPEYEILYKQAVGTEDIFLGMGNKNMSTSSCEDMIIKIKLPDTKSSELDLNVKQRFLDCRTPKFKLGLHLPHPVDHKNGKAKFDVDTHTLTVTCRMTREYDFMNF